MSRYIPEGEQSRESKTLLATEYFMVKGLPWIYQGQEIGMENCHIDSIDEVDDISSIDAYNVSVADGVSEKEALHAIEKYGRDNARTPFQWDDSENAGFTSGTPWLRVNPNYREINLKAQQERGADSVLAFYQELIALRKVTPHLKRRLSTADSSPLWNDGHNVIAYCRTGAEQTILVAANFNKSNT